MDVGDQEVAALVLFELHVLAVDVGEEASVLFELQLLVVDVDVAALTLVELHVAEAEVRGYAARDLVCINICVYYDRILTPRSGLLHCTGLYCTVLYCTAP